MGRLMDRAWVIIRVVPTDDPICDATRSKTVPGTAVCYLLHLLGEVTPNQRRVYDVRGMCIVIRRHKQQWSRLILGWELGCQDAATRRRNTCG